METWGSLDVPHVVLSAEGCLLILLLQEKNNSDRCSSPQHQICPGGLGTAEAPASCFQGDALCDSCQEHPAWDGAAGEGPAASLGVSRQDQVHHSRCQGEIVRTTGEQPTGGEVLVWLHARPAQLSSVGAGHRRLWHRALLLAPSPFL